MHLQPVSAKRWVGLLVCLVALVACSHSDLPAVYGSAPIDASLVQLLAEPAEFDGRLVRVIGFCSIEFEGNAIYLHREDYEQGILKNAMWLSLGDMLPPARQELSARLHEKYCIVEGRITSRQNGHMGAFGGEIAELTRLDLWSTGADHGRSRRPPPPPPPPLPRPS
jgi:hypothetical protein